jgi:hypothetical protein
MLFHVSFHCLFDNRTSNEPQEKELGEEAYQHCIELCSAPLSMPCCRAVMLRQLKSAGLPGLRAFIRCAVDIRNIDVPAAAAPGALSGATTSGRRLRNRRCGCRVYPPTGLVACPPSTAPPLWGLEGRAVTVQAASTEKRDPKDNEAGQGAVP